MFDRLLLLDLRENVSKLDMQAFAELRSYTAPPPVIRDVLKAVLSVFYQKESEEGVFEDWTVTRNVSNSQQNYVFIYLVSFFFFFLTFFPTYLLIEVVGFFSILIQVRKLV